MHSSFHCLHLAVYLDTSLEETGDALVDHPVSCTSLLTAAEMLSCNNMAGFDDRKHASLMNVTVAALHCCCCPVWQSVHSEALEGSVTLEIALQHGL